MIRLLAKAGLQVKSASKTYGSQPYGAIGAGIGTAEGAPQLQGSNLREFDDPITAIVWGPLATIPYGAGNVRRGQPTITLDRVRFLDDDIYSFEFIEDEALAVAMRILDDGSLICHEFVEV
jgi:hypothetical protein